MAYRYYLSPMLITIFIFLPCYSNQTNPVIQTEELNDHQGKMATLHYTSYTLKNFLWLKILIKNNEQITIGKSVIWYFKNRQEGIMQSLYIKPAFRKQGLGTLLFLHAARKIKENGCSLLSGFPRAQNPQQDVSDPDQETLIRFYKKLGAYAHNHGEYRLNLNI